MAHVDDMARKTTDPSRLEGALPVAGEVLEDEWKPGRQEYAVMITVAVISLMVALDATILVSVLPVGFVSNYLRYREKS